MISIYLFIWLSLSLCVPKCMLLSLLLLKKLFSASCPCWCYPLSGADCLLCFFNETLSLHRLITHKIRRWCHAPISHATKNFEVHLLLFFKTIFLSSYLYPENSKGTLVIICSMNMGYEIFIWHCQDSNSQPVPFAICLISLTSHLLTLSIFFLFRISFQDL